MYVYTHLQTRRIRVLSGYREREDTGFERSSMFPDNAERRRERLRRLVIRIQTNPGLPTDDLVKLLVAWYGLTGRTAQGYITELSRYGFIREERIGTKKKDGSPDPAIDFGMGWFANDISKEFLK